MTRKKTMLDLAARVEEDENPCSSIAQAIGPEYKKHVEAVLLLGSMDYAETLHNQLLPDWEWQLRKSGAYLYVLMTETNSHRFNIYTRATPARAWLSAILRALALAEGEV